MIGWDDASMAKCLLEMLEANGGFVAKETVAARLPHLDDSEIARVVAMHVPDAVESEVAGIPCWKRLQLPESFAEHLRETAANLREMGFYTTLDNVNLALSVRYGKNFRTAYGLEEDGAFRKFLSKYTLLAKLPPLVDETWNQKKSQASVVKPRSWTRFRDLGIPIGARLEFTGAPNITVIVVDDSRTVEYKGRRSRISTLATSLLNEHNGSALAYVSGGNHFRYDGETLYERRMRLESGKTNPEDCDND